MTCSDGPTHFNSVPRFTVISSLLDNEGIWFWLQRPGCNPIAKQHACIAPRNPVLVHEEDL